MNQPNARFWIWDRSSDSMIKLTLKPGQMIRHGQGRLTDEGSAWDDATYRYSAVTGHVYRDTYHAETDCDGRHESGSETRCHLLRLHANNAWQGTNEKAQAGKLNWIGLFGDWEIYDAEIMVPDWQAVPKTGWQRDHAAEAMGY